VEVPKGDPGNSLSRAELVEKAVRLAAYRGAATEAQVREAAEKIWQIDSVEVVGNVVQR